MPRFPVCKALSVSIRFLDPTPGIIYCNNRDHSTSLNQLHDVSTPQLKFLPGLQRKIIGTNFSLNFWQFTENSFYPGRRCISFYGINAISTKIITNFCQYLSFPYRMYFKIFVWGHPANILLVKIDVKPMISWNKETPCKLDHYYVLQRA